MSERHAYTMTPALAESGRRLQDVMDKIGTVLEDELRRDREQQMVVEFPIELTKALLALARYCQNHAEEREVAIKAVAEGFCPNVETVEDERFSTVWRRLQDRFIAEANAVMQAPAGLTPTSAAG